MINREFRGRPRGTVDPVDEPHASPILESDDLRMQGVRGGHIDISNLPQSSILEFEPVLVTGCMHLENDRLGAAHDTVVEIPLAGQRSNVGSGRQERAQCSDDLWLKVGVNRHDTRLLNEVGQLPRVSQTS